MALSPPCPFSLYGSRSPGWLLTPCVSQFGSDFLIALLGLQACATGPGTEHLFSSIHLLPALMFLHCSTVPAELSPLHPGPLLSPLNSPLLLLRLFLLTELDTPASATPVQGLLLTKATLPVMLQRPPNPPTAPVCELDIPASTTYPLHIL